MSDYLQRLISRGAGLALPAPPRPPAAPPGPDFPERPRLESSGEAQTLKAGDAPPRPAPEERRPSIRKPDGTIESVRGESSVEDPRSPVSAFPSTPSGTLRTHSHPAVEQTRTIFPLSGIPLNVPPSDLPPAGEHSPMPAGEKAVLQTTIEPSSSSPPPGMTPAAMEKASAKAGWKSGQTPEPSSAVPGAEFPKQESPRAQGPAPVPAQLIFPEIPADLPHHSPLERTGSDPSSPRKEFAARSAPAAVPASVPYSLRPAVPESGFTGRSAERETVPPLFSGKEPPVRPSPTKTAVILPAPVIQQPAAFPEPAQSAAAAEPAPIHIHIGTVEVRAPAPPPPAARVPPPAGGFADFERIRNYENWEMD
jgi:hypothetical protein